VDSGVAEGSEISIHYDPLLAKLIAFAETRDAAIDRAASALTRYPILGLRTNVAFLCAILGHPSFHAGTVDTAFVEERIAELRDTSEPGDAVQAAASFSKPASPIATARRVERDPWATLERWGR
jgi:3-methylcrotonyl-CoA carboxylase alpha subunit